MNNTCTTQGCFLIYKNFAESLKEYLESYVRLMILRIHVSLYQIQWPTQVNMVGRRFSQHTLGNFWLSRMTTGIFSTE
jgi:hypothetical protein